MKYNIVCVTTTLLGEEIGRKVVGAMHEEHLAQHRAFSRNLVERGDDIFVVVVDEGFIPSFVPPPPTPIVAKAPKVKPKPERGRTTERVFDHLTPPKRRTDVEEVARQMREQRLQIMREMREQDDGVL